MPVEQLIERHDSDAKHAGVGVNYYLEEIARRDSQAVLEAVAANTAEVKNQVEEFAELSKESGDRMERLTYAIAALTLANLMAVVVLAA